MIVLRSKNVDTDQVEDVGFSLHENQLFVRTIRTKAKNRGDHGNAKDLRWSEYGLGAAFADLDWNGNENVYKQGSSDFDLAAYQNQDGRKILYLEEGTSDEIAKKIINYAKTHQNLCLLPLIDVARYFDVTFQQVIVQEGYELLNSIRVERKVPQGHEGDPQAGYVPCKYTISGDNDDHLVLMMKFDRGSDKKLRIEFRGKSQGNSVQESKALSYSIFNDNAMYKLSMSIIYTFAKKIHLSKARKIDNLIDYFCCQTGCKAVRCSQVENDNILKNYKVWNRSRTNYFDIQVTKMDFEHYNLDIKDKNIYLGTIAVDTTNNI